MAQEVLRYHPTDEDGTHDSRYYTKEQSARVYVQDTEPTDAPEGSIWVAPNGGYPSTVLTTDAGDDRYAQIGQVAELEAATIGMPTVVTKNYTRHLSRYASLAAAIADLPDGGANGGEIRVDGDVSAADIAATITSRIHLIGRGSSVTGIVTPQAYSGNVITLDGASGSVIAGFAGMIEDDGTADNAILITVQGDLDDLLIEDVVGTGYNAAINIRGGQGTTPGTVRSLTLRRVGAHGSGTNVGIMMDDVDGWLAENVEAIGNDNDGLKLRKNTKNGVIIGGRYNDNGGGGINGYAGGQSFRMIGVETARNGSNGIALKTGPLNKDDAANYGYVRRIEIVSPNCYENLSAGIDLTMESASLSDLAAPVMAEITITGGMLRANGSHGLNNNARNVTVSGTHAIHNDEHGFYSGQRSMDTHYIGCISIANSQSGAGSFNGFHFAGNGGAVIGCTAIGADSDTIGQESDYGSLTKYHGYGFRWGSTASGVWTMQGSTSRYHTNAGEGTRIDSTIGSYIFNLTGSSAPTSAAVYAGIGSTYVQTGATTEDAVIWRKTSGAPNAALVGWQRNGGIPRRTALPAAGATYKGVLMVKDNEGASDDTLHICVQTGASTYAWKQVTVT